MKAACAGFAAAGRAPPSRAFRVAAGSADVAALLVDEIGHRALGVAELRRPLALMHMVVVRLAAAGVKGRAGAVVGQFEIQKAKPRRNGAALGWWLSSSQRFFGLPLSSVPVTSCFPFL